MRRYGWKIIVLLLLAAVIFLWVVKAPMMASYLTKKLGVNVSVGSISMWPSQTTIHRFRINNPPGFKTKNAFQAETIQIDYLFKQLMASPTEINQIHLDNILLNVTFSNPLGTSNNWTEIAARMPKPAGRAQVIIHKLILTNLTVEIRGLGLIGAPTTKTIARMEFNEIDSREGFPTKELIQRVFGGAGLQQYIQDAFNPQKVLEKYLSPFKNFGSENERVVEEKEAV